MNINDVCTVISTVGFPIVCCIACGYYINNTQKEFTKAINSLENAIVCLTAKVRIECNNE